MKIRPVGAELFKQSQQKYVRKSESKVPYFIATK